MNIGRPPDHRAHRLLLLAGLIVSGAVLRLPGLSTDLQLDEVWSLHNAFAATSWLELLRLKTDNNHHLTSLYIYAIGPGVPEVIYRLPAYLWGIAIIPLAWLIGARESRTTAWTTAVLFTTSAALVFYSSEARGYSAAVCLTLSAWYCLLEYAEAPAARWIVGFTISSLAGVMSHQTFILFYVGAFIWCDAHMQRHHRLRAATRLTMRMFAVSTAAIALFVAIALVGQQIGGGLPFDLPVIIAQTLSAVAGGPQTGAGLWLVAAMAGSIIVIAIWSTHRAGDDRWVLYATAGVIAPLVIVALRRPPTLAPRYFLVPAAVLLLAVGDFLGRAMEQGGGRRILSQALVGTFVTAGVWFSFSPNVSRGSYRQALAHILHESTALTTVASTNQFGGSDWRTEMMVSYYQRTMSAQGRVRYVPAQQASVEGAEWVIDEGTGNDPSSQSITDAHGREYTMDGTYPAGPLSGIVWHLYRLRRAANSKH